MLLSSLEKYVPRIASERRITVTDEAFQLPNLQWNQKRTDLYVNVREIAASDKTNTLIDVFQTLLNALTEDDVQELTPVI